MPLCRQPSKHRQVTVTTALTVNRHRPYMYGRRRDGTWGMPSQQKQRNLTELFPVERGRTCTGFSAHFLVISADFQPPKRPQIKGAKPVDNTGTPSRFSLELDPDLE
jgi:hypothetical protein